MEIETEDHFPLHRLFLNTLLSLAQFLDGTLDTTSNNNVFAENWIVYVIKTITDIYGTIDKYLFLIKNNLKSYLGFTKLYL